MTVSGEVRNDGAYGKIVVEATLIEWLENGEKNVQTEPSDPLWLSPDQTETFEITLYLRDRKHQYEVRLDFSDP